MRVFAPNAFRYSGIDYCQGWQDMADDSLVRTLNASLLVFLDQPIQPNGLKIRNMTQAAYDALVVYDNSTLYIIVG